MTNRDCPDRLLQGRVIDLHAHAVLEATLGAAGPHGPALVRGSDGKDTFVVGNYRIPGSRYRGSAFMDMGTRLERMNAFGIDFQVIGPNPLTYFHFIDAHRADAFCRIHNDALAKLVRLHPGRLAGLAAVPVQDVARAIAQVQRSAQELGLWGVQMGTDIPHPLDSACLDPFYAQLSRLNMPLFLHPANAGIDGPKGDPGLERFDLGTTVGYAGQETLALATMIFGGVLERHPNLQVWISHGGGTIAFLAAKLEKAARVRPWSSIAMKKDGGFQQALSRFWFDSHVEDPRGLAMLVELVGEDRMVYGTNFAGWDQPRHGPMAIVPPSFADNTRRLFRLGMDGHS